MALLPVQIVPPTLPDGYCPGTLQEFTNDIFSAATIQSSITLDNIVISDTAPTDTTKIWFRTVGGDPTDPNQFYKWNTTLAAWVKAHPSAPSGFERRIFMGTVGGGGDLETYDGGAAGAVGPAAGPMWEVATEFNGRSPMGVGSIPDATPPKSLALNENYGEGSHLQDAQEVGPHTHPLPQGYELDGVNLTPKLAVDADTLTATLVLDTSSNAYTTTQQKFPVIHPVVGVYFIKRTARVYYLAV